MAIVEKQTGYENQANYWHWTLRLIPSSWLKMSPIEGSNDRDRGDWDRGRGDNDLDDTRSGYRRRREDNQPPRIEVPLGIVVTVTLYLLGQLITSVWWAATQQNNLQHEMMDRAKEESRLWDGLQTYRAEVGALRIEIARITGQNNDKQKRED